MKIEEALRTWILSLTGMSALVGSRVYPIDATENSGTNYPYIVYFLINEKKGYIAECKNYTDYYQISVHSKTYTEAQTISNIIRDASNEAAPVLYSGISLYSFEYVGKGRGSINDENGYYTQPIDIKVSYKY